MSIKTSQEKLIQLGYGEYMRPFGADGENEKGNDERVG